jgi:hypothetical protein
MPAPFYPRDVIVYGATQQVCLNVRHVTEDKCPILTNLLITSKCSIGMNGLLTLITGIKAVHKSVYVVLVYGTLQTFNGR